MKKFRTLQSLDISKPLRLYLIRCRTKSTGHFVFCCLVTINKQVPLNTTNSVRWKRGIHRWNYHLGISTHYRKSLKLPICICTHNIFIHNVKCPLIQLHSQNTIRVGVYDMSRDLRPFHNLTQQICWVKYIYVHITSLCFTHE